MTARTEAEIACRIARKRMTKLLAGTPSPAPAADAAQAGETTTLERAKVSPAELDFMLTAGLVL